MSFHLASYLSDAELFAFLSAVSVILFSAVLDKIRRVVLPPLCLLFGQRTSRMPKQKKRKKKARRKKKKRRKRRKRKTKGRGRRKDRCNLWRLNNLREQRVLGIATQVGKHLGDKDRSPPTPAMEG